MPGGFYNKSSVGDREAIVDFARSIFNWQVSIIHVDSGVGASFPAFISDYSETFQSDWNEETYFGRNDKVGRHAGTSRTINLSLELPAIARLIQESTHIRLITLLQQCTHRIEKSQVRMF